MSHIDSNQNYVEFDFSIGKILLLYFFGFYE